MEDWESESSNHFTKEKKFSSDVTNCGDPTDTEKDSSKFESKSKTQSSQEDETLEYELNSHDGKSDLAQASYSKEDFGTESDNDDDSGEEEIKTKGKDPKGVSEPSTKKLRQTTLDDFSHGKPSESQKVVKKRTTRVSQRWSDKDTDKYRKGYPGQRDDTSLKDNLLFYTGQIRSSPDGDFIDAIHSEWFGQYEFLERHHGYIQWLFPIREEGMNWHAQALQLHEAKAIQKDKKAQKRVLTSFQLMLDFYGMKLDDVETGAISRATNWERQYNNLNWSSHNYLRITRILKSLGELGFEHLKKPFLQFIMEEAITHRTLSRTLRSCRDYWIGALKNDEDRAELYDIISAVNV